MIKILKYFININLFISFSAFILSYSFAKMVQSEKRVEYSLFVFFSTLFLYNFHKLVKVFCNHENIPLKGFILENKNILIRITCFALIGSISMFYITFHLNFIFLTLILLSSVLSFFYVLKIKMKNLREIPFLKIYIVSIIWTSVICIIPLFLKQNIFCENLIFSAFHFFFFFFMTISFDIRDIEYDQQKMKTIPQMLGIKKAKLLAVSCWILFYTFQIIYVKNYIHFSLLLILALYQLYFILTTKKELSTLYFGLGVDSGILLLGVYYLFFNYFA